MQGGAHTFTKGIWKSVYITSTSSAVIRHVVPQIFYEGTYPTAPLTDGKHEHTRAQARAGAYGRGAADCSRGRGVECWQ